MVYVAVQAASQPERDARRRETIDHYFQAIQSGDYTGLHELLTPDATTLWPQSGERISGPTSCIKIYENYPGAPPKYHVERVSGTGDVWVAELLGDYGDTRWHAVSIIRFEGARIARVTDYFGPSLPAPEWRQQWVERDEAID